MNYQLSIMKWAVGEMGEMGEWGDGGVGRWGEKKLMADD
jgi:hypothetical protein